MTSLIVMLLLSVGAPPNVVLLSVDTLRADHLGVYGSDFNATPNLDRLAGKSLLFEDAICEIHMTVPSFSAMHSSRLPRVTGAVINWIPLPPGTPTVAMLFQAAGYETAAILSNPVLGKELSGLDSGFAHYDTRFDPGGKGVLIEDERAAGVVTDRALSWLKQRDSKKPFFLWVLYMDPHDPYMYRPGFDEQLEVRPESIEYVNLDPASAMNKAEAKRYNYKTEVAFLDRHIQRFLDALPKEDTYILFVSDHGEALGERQIWGHTRNIYQTTMHIPMFMHGPGIEPGRIDRPVRGIDVGTTLLGLAGIAPMASMKGMDLRKELPQANTPRCFELYKGKPARRDASLENKRNPRDATSVMIWHQTIIQERWKLIRNNDDSLELYNLAQDPGEEKNIASKHPEKVTSLTAQLDEWHQSTPRNKPVAKELTDEDMETLKALGYLE